MEIYVKHIWNRKEQINARNYYAFQCSSVSGKHVRKSLEVSFPFSEMNTNPQKYMLIQLVFVASIHCAQQDSYDLC